MNPSAPSPSRIVLASNNAGKLAEFSQILRSAGIAMVAQGRLGVSEAEEPYGTFVENALAKARHAASMTGLPALADDSGLCVDSLDGAPGVHSARFSALHGGEKSDEANNRYLLGQLRAHSNRSASYIAVLVYMRSAEDPRPIIAEGVWAGEIIDEPHGAHGFGYDPYFYLPKLGKTAAEISPRLKNRLSHRAQALKKLLRALSTCREI